jgi:CelD/BcsL family acetyltransferase involved in cellulose biosynthesis
MATIPRSQATAVVAKPEATVTTRVLDGFDDRSFRPEQWEQLLRRGNQDIVYLTWEYQRTWWETFGKGKLILILAEQAGRVVALAPFYSRSGMVYLIGNAYWQADKLDFIGDIDAPGVIDAILQTARELAPNFAGFRFEFVPETSHTGEVLKAAAKRLGLSCYQEWEENNLTTDLSRDPQGVILAAGGKRLRKRESFFRRRGELTIEHLQDSKTILPLLPEFFAQHINRWKRSGKSSLFVNDAHRTFYERLTQRAVDKDWLRFSRLAWNGRPIAFHYGFCYRGRYFWNAASFAPDLAEHSPGQILLRHLMEAAIEEGAAVFDFGTGDQAFKRRFASDHHRVKGWGIFLSLWFLLSRPIFLECCELASDWS